MLFSIKHVSNGIGMLKMLLTLKASNIWFTRRQWHWEILCMCFVCVCVHSCLCEQIFNSAKLWPWCPAACASSLWRSSLKVELSHLGLVTKVTKGDRKLLHTTQNTEITITFVMHYFEICCLVASSQLLSWTNLQLPRLRICSGWFHPDITAGWRRRMWDIRNQGLTFTFFALLALDATRSYAVGL